MADENKTGEEEPVKEVAKPVDPAVTNTAEKGVANTAEGEEEEGAVEVTNTVASATNTAEVKKEGAVEVTNTVEDATEKLKDALEDAEEALKKEQAKEIVNPVG